jgi:hypothetical protein
MLRAENLSLRHLIVFAVFCTLAAPLSAADKIKIDVRQSDTAIRQQLLQLISLGTAAQDVY